MKKLKKIWQLKDPYPNLWYELFCYFKTALGLVLVVFGFFFILSPLLKKDLVILGFAIILNPLGENILVWEEKTFGQNLTAFSLTLGVLLVGLGFWFFWQLKLVKKLLKVLFH